jgi:hypothetical protein
MIVPEFPPPTAQTSDADAPQIPTMIWFVLVGTLVHVVPS